jgi:hypothetical protein
MSKAKKDKYYKRDDDYESDSDDEECGKTDFVRVAGNLLGNINIKLGFIIFLIGLIIFSDLFTKNILSHMGNTLDGESPNTKGTIIQLTILTLLYLVFDLLNKYEII